MSDKYFRTPHLPYSPGGTNDDKRVANDRHLTGEIVITEKMDGSNVCLTRDHLFARSHGHAPTHASFDLLKALHAQAKGWMGEGVSYFGEWCLAKHSIAYNELPSYFLLFGVRDDKTNAWLPWSDVVFLANYHSLNTVPVLWSGRQVRAVEPLIEDLLEQHPSGMCGADPEIEGVVVRRTGGFHQDDAAANIAKWVRADHVQTDTHWKKNAIVKNRLKQS
jgi:hypothetical protein